MQRRQAIKLLSSGLIASSSFGLTTWSASSLALNAHVKNKKIVWIVLRGAMDSLHAVVPTFDQYLKKHRADLVEPIANSLLPMDRGFGLHPDLAFFHQLYQKKQLTPIVATATPYRQRSHFDAQDILESGKTPVDQESGWLARAITEYSGDGLALSQSIPITLRGNDNIHSWYPSSLPEADDDIYARLHTLYANDELLSNRLTKAMETQKMVGDMRSPKRPKLPELAAACGKLLKSKNTVNCAMMEMGGWDTHNNLVRRLSNQFAELDAGLKTLHDGMGEQWQNTLVIIATEFGRTVAINGTKGTDHGTASALFLAGGALKGGKILGEWPGLAPEQLFDGRDLMPTSNIFSWINTAIQQHWQLTDQQTARIMYNAPALNVRLV